MSSFVETIDGLQYFECYFTVIVQRVLSERLPCNIRSAIRRTKFDEEHK